MRPFAPLQRRPGARCCCSDRVGAKRCACAHLFFQAGALSCAWTPSAIASHLNSISLYTPCEGRYVHVSQLHCEQRSSQPLSCLNTRKSPSLCGADQSLCKVLLAESKTLMSAPHFAVQAHVDTSCSAGSPAFVQRKVLALQRAVVPVQLLQQPRQRYHLLHARAREREANTRSMRPGSRRRELARTTLHRNQSLCALTLEAAFGERGSRKHTHTFLNRAASTRDSSSLELRSPLSAPVSRSSPTRSTTHTLERDIAQRARRTLFLCCCVCGLGGGVDL